MPQIRIPKENLSNGQFFVEGSEAHHLSRVLRKKIGDEIDFFDGEGLQFKGRLTHIDSSTPRIQGQVIKTVKNVKNGPKIFLFQGLPRGSKFDYVIEKSVELGVDSIVPFLSRKNPIKLPPEDRAKKQKRWDSLSIAAAKQSQRSLIPTIAACKSFLEIESNLKDGMSLVLDPSNQADPLAHYMSDLKKESQQVNVIVGPESGFTDEELDLLQKWGAKRVTLGKSILRTETAGLAILSILNFELGKF